jgi:hypothetical protein
MMMLMMMIMLMMMMMIMMLLLLTNTCMLCDLSGLKKDMITWVIKLQKYFHTNNIQNKKLLNSVRRCQRPCPLLVTIYGLGFLDFPLRKNGRYINIYVLKVLNYHLVLYNIFLRNIITVSYHIININNCNYNEPVWPLLQKFVCTAL